MCAGTVSYEPMLSIVLHDCKLPELEKVALVSHYSKTDALQKTFLEVPILEDYTNLSRPELLVLNSANVYLISVVLGIGAVIFYSLA